MRTLAAKDGFEGFCGFGVGILKSGPDQLHVGIVYHDEEAKEVRFFHFAFHFLLLKDDPKAFPSLRWANSGLEVEERILMIDWANKAAAHQLLAYGFESSGPVFNKDGTMRALQVGKGVTCATFLMAAHHVHGLDLLTPPWPQRKEDAEWQAHIIQEIKKYCDKHGYKCDEHIEALRSDIGLVRYRPEEVAAAVASTNAPLVFQDARKIADEIVAELAVS